MGNYYSKTRHVAILMTDALRCTDSSDKIKLCNPAHGDIVVNGTVTKTTIL